ncbi:DNA-binding transcriptional regulator, AcrR family [Amycolatopsis lurida]|nr:DNA-binding transcriptional regulator, AcrR family [Amycolatopsis lurida]
MAGNVKSPDPTRRNERSRQAILTATTELLGEVGYPKLAVEAIASRAGVGKQTIYRWWPDKGALVLDAYLALVQGADELTFPDTGDLEADLRTVLRSTVDPLADKGYEAFYRALLTAIQGDAKLSAELDERLVRPWLEATRERFRVAARTGRIDDADIDTGVDLFYGAVYYRWLLRTGPLSEEFGESVVRLVLRALEPGSDTGRNEGQARPSATLDQIYEPHGVEMVLDGVGEPVQHALPEQAESGRPVDR